MMRASVSRTVAYSRARVLTAGVAATVNASRAGPLQKADRLKFERLQASVERRRENRQSTAHHSGDNAKMIDLSDRRRNPFAGTLPSRRCTASRGRTALFYPMEDPTT